MAALYSFADDIDSLPGKMKQLGDIIVRVLEQTTECGIFFREYTGCGFLGMSLNTSLAQGLDDLSVSKQVVSSARQSRTIRRQSPICHQPSLSFEMIFSLELDCIRHSYQAKLMTMLRNSVSLLDYLRGYTRR